MKNLFISTLFFLSVFGSMTGKFNEQNLEELNKNDFFHKILEVAEKDISTFSGFEGKTWEIEKIYKVEAQVVAGVNYKILCEIMETETGISRPVTLKINFQGWNGNVKMLDVNIEDLKKLSL